MNRRQAVICRLPRLVELIAPTGSSYVSLLPPPLHSDRAFNHRLYIENGEIGEQKNLQDGEFRKYMEAARTVASWMVMHDQEVRDLINQTAESSSFQGVIMSFSKFETDRNRCITVIYFEYLLFCRSNSL